MEFKYPAVWGESKFLSLLLPIHEMKILRKTPPFDNGFGISDIPDVDALTHFLIEMIIQEISMAKSLNDQKIINRAVSESHVLINMKGWIA
jgi:hypothetical protein